MEENSRFDQSTIFGCKSGLGRRTSKRMLTERTDTFTNNPENHNVEANPQPPSGPPLLQNRESEFLTEFFNNPDSSSNTYDPNLLQLQGDPYNDSSNLFGNFTHNWMSNPSMDFTGSTGAVQGIAQFASTRSHESQFAYDPFTGGGEQAMESGPSQDVYAAARLLHDQQTSRSNDQPQDDSGGYNGGDLKHSGQKHLSSIAHSGTSPMQSLYVNMPYNFPPREVSRPLSAQAKGTTFQDHSHPNGHGGYQDRGTLNFGSDKEFQTENYTASDQNYPDAQLNEYATRALYRPGDAAQNEQMLPSPQTANPKRRRRSFKTEDASSDDGYDDDYEEAKHPRRKRRSQAVKDSERDRDGLSIKARSAKRSSKAPSQSSPGRRSRSSPPTARAPRENLSEEQKRNNHILSEQKRRNVIKQGFEDINRMVPELRTGGFSKSNMLLEAAKFMRQLQDGNEQLRQQLESLEGG